MTQAELLEFVKKLRTYATSAPTLSAKLSADSAVAEGKLKRTRTLSPEAARKKAILDSL